MKVRVLWVPPAEKDLKSGEVYDLPEDQAAHLLAAEEAERVPDDTPAHDRIPAPEPEPEPQASEPEAQPEAAPTKGKK